MWKKYNKYRVMKPFFDNPHPKGIGYQLREISRMIGLAPKSVSEYLKELQKNGLIVKKKHRIHGYPVYYANSDCDLFRLYKKIDMISSIYECGLLKYLEDKTMPDVIILFGSASRGEDTADSDIDIFVQSRKIKLDLSKYEKALKRRINVFFSPALETLSNELKNNIINGIKISGYLKVY